MRIGEPVTVIASFGTPYRIKPLRFQWSGKSFDVQEITYSWKTKEGHNSLYHFSVTNGGALYELIFDATSLLWRIENLEA